MKASEIIELPTLYEAHVSSWRDSWVHTAFSIEPHQIDEDMLNRADAPPITSHVKLSHVYDGGERSNEVVVLSLGDRPFAFLRHCDDASDLYVFDSGVHQEAYEAVLACRKVHPLQFTSIDLNDENNELLEFNGVMAKSVGDVTRFVDIDHLDGQCNVMFDEDKFDAAMRTYVSAAGGYSAIQDGFTCENMRAATVTAFRVGLVGDWEILEVGGDDPTVAAGKASWLGIVVTNDEGTYTFGVNGYAMSMRSLSWMSYLSIERVGGPEAFAQYQQAQALSL